VTEMGFATAVGASWRPRQSMEGDADGTISQIPAERFCGTEVR